MRPIHAMLTATFCLSLASAPAFGQSDLAAASVPTDPRELATGRINTPTTPKDISDAFALIDHARRNIGIYEDGDVAFSMKISFTATGAVSYIGSGSMEETRIAGGRERWYARIGEYSMLRIFDNRVAYDDKPPGPIPFRIQMLRAAFFWPFSTARPRNHVRTAASEWNGKRVTCVLLSEPSNMEPVPSGGRSWREREYCIDPKTTLLEIYSEAPGIYVVYDYREAAKFDARTLPRQVTVFEAGAETLAAHLDSLEDPGTPTPDMFQPTAKTVSVGAVLATPLHYYRNPPQNGGVTMRGPVTKIEPIIIHASIGDDGAVLEAESLQNYAPALSQSALDRVKSINFGRPLREGITVRQQELFVEVDVLPPAGP